MRFKREDNEGAVIPTDNELGEEIRGLRLRTVEPKVFDHTTTTRATVHAELCNKIEEYSRITIFLFDPRIDEIIDASVEPELIRELLTIQHKPFDQHKENDYALSCYIPPMRIEWVRDVLDKGYRLHIGLLNIDTGRLSLHSFAVEFV